MKHQLLNKLVGPKAFPALCGQLSQRGLHWQGLCQFNPYIIYNKNRTESNRIEANGIEKN